MKKIGIVLFIFVITIFAKAQYATLDAILTRLEEKKGINQNLENISIDNKKFLLIKKFDDHTERNFIIISGKTVTYVEVFDDVKTGETTSNVFTGDIIRTKKNMISIRANQLEGKTIPIPITKTFLFTKQKEILYLIDINNRERWIDEKSFKEIK